MAFWGMNLWRISPTFRGTNPSRLRFQIPSSHPIPSAGGSRIARRLWPTNWTKHLEMFIRKNPSLGDEVIFKGIGVARPEWLPTPVVLAAPCFVLWSEFLLNPFWEIWYSYVFVASNSLPTFFGCGFPKTTNFFAKKRDRSSEKKTVVAIKSGAFIKLWNDNEHTTIQLENIHDRPSVFKKNTWFCSCFTTILFILASMVICL